MNIYSAHIVKYYKSIIAVSVVIILSFIPADNSDKLNLSIIPHFDKIIHFFMYLFLSLALFIDIYKKKKKPTKINILLLSVIILIFSGMIEIIQFLFIVSRSGSFADTAANLVGIIIASLFYFKTHRMSLFSK